MSLLRYRLYKNGNRYKVRNAEYEGRGSFVCGIKIDLAEDTSAHHDVTCFDGGDGSITVIASHGRPPYIYSMDSTFASYNSTGIFDNLSITGPIEEGTDEYGGILTCTKTIYAKDSLGFIASVDVQLKSPVELGWLNCPDNIVVYCDEGEDYATVVPGVDFTIPTLSTEANNAQQRINGQKTDNHYSYLQSPFTIQYRVQNECRESDICSFTITVLPNLDPPTISLDWQTGYITITNPNDIGYIKYKVVRGNIDSGWTIYSGPFLMSNNDFLQRTVYAKVIDDISHTDSSEALATFNVIHSGSSVSTYSTSNIIQCSLTPLVNNTAIQNYKATYTDDGTDPDYNSQVFPSVYYAQRYGDPKIVKVHVFSEGYIPSRVTTVIDSFDKPTAPVISFDSVGNTVTIEGAGNVLTPQMSFVTNISNAANGYMIFYTIDGSTPTNQSLIYSTPFNITTNSTIKAVIVAFDAYSSDVTIQEIFI